MDELVSKYLEGKLSEKDLQDLERKFPSDEAWGKFRQRIPAWKHPWRTIWKIAAGLAALLVIGTVSYRMGSEDLLASFEETTVTVPAGSRLKVSLPDGSTAELNGGTTLRYSQGFGISDRKLSFDGEGYFEIARNESLPLQIKSQSLLVEVLGTKFNLKDYATDASATLHLTQGLVKVGSLLSDQGATLSPGQSIVLDKSDGSLSVRRSSSDRADWTTGALFFNEEPLSEIATQLSRTFGVDIIIKDESLRDVKFYGYFDGESLGLRDILDKLSATDGFKFEISGRNAVIYR